MADVTESAAHLLTIVSKLLAKLSADDVDSLLVGDSKLAVVPQSWRPVKTRSTATSTVLPISAESVQAALDTASDRASGIEYVESLSLTVRQLRQLALELGIQAPSRLTKSPLIEHIVNSAVGSRLSSEAIREGGW